MLHHPCILGGPQQREQNQNSKPKPGVTMVHHTTKRGFKDCPGFVNSTGWLGPKRGPTCYITPAFSGVPNKGNKIKTRNLSRGSPWCTTQQSVDSKIVQVSSIAPDGWGPKEGGNATSPLHSQGSPAKGTKFSGAFGATLCMASSH